MKNPVTENLRSIVIYIIIWILVIFIHSVTLVLLYKLPVLISITDGMVFNSIFAAMGVILWYPVFYNDIEKNTTSTLLINHLSILSLTLILWIGFSNFILKSIFSSYDYYVIFIETGIPWRVFVGSFFYFATVLIYYLFISANNFREHIIQESHLREKIKEAELHALKVQINPHFLFNSLNSISSLTISNPEKAHEMIVKLSTFFRYSLAHNSTDFVTFEKEIENIESYIEIERIRFGNKLIFKKNIDTKCLNQKLPYLILQPLIENAVKHGVYESIEPVTIDVSCSESEKNMMKIIITNDFDKNYIPQKGTGTGLKNIKERLRIIYKLNNLMAIEKGDNKFKVTLFIPKII
jgi:hypothetical protein